MSLTKKYNSNFVKLVTPGIVRKKHPYFAPPDEPYIKAMKRIITKQLIKPNPAIVPVYNFGMIWAADGQVSYFYDMARCKELSRTEQKVIQSLTKFFQPPYLSDKERIKYATLIKFIDKARKMNYEDLHYLNIMKYEGRYVLIDLEGFF